MTNHPDGTVTFLFSDIEGSTRISQKYPRRWETIRARHNAILQSAMQANNGYVFQIIGDAFCVAFHTASDALRAAMKSQLDLQAEDWGDTPIKVRMGIHTGQAEIQPGGLYQGYLAMCRVQRLMSAAHGGQTLLSLPAQELVSDDLPEKVSLLYLGERRLKDLIRPEHIYQLVLEGQPVDFPPLKTLDAYRHNLPVQITSFIGREKEIADLKQAIASHSLVTLIGAGGTGKTRLALQVAAEVLDQFPEGVWFVNLAPLTNPELIPQTILASLAVNVQAGQSSLQVLTEYLLERKLLLILDNCEHLVCAVAVLVACLLNKAAQVKILATSREALKIDGEQNWYVPSLSLPDMQHMPDVPALAQYEAVRLFTDRALLVQPNFAVTNENAPAIARVCHRLDGIPLAIELAAARVKAMDVEQIYKRLDDRFHLLTAGSRTAIPRHRTLRAVLEWSHHLLSDQEQTLFRRLSVFVGGCRLEEAEQVCTLEAGELDVLDLLANLIDKSLLVLDNSGGGPRYSMLETTRQFAREKLIEAGEEQKLREQHRDCYLKLAEQGAIELKSHDQLRWLHLLQHETDNLRAALEWSFAAGQLAETALKLVNAVTAFWDFGKNFNEAFPWLDKAYELSNAIKGTPLKAKLLFNQATYISNLLGRAKDAIPLLEESIGIYRKLGDDYRVDLAYSLCQLGHVIYFQGEHEIGMANDLEALKLFQEAGDKCGQGWALNYLFDLKSADGDFETACAMTRQGVVLCKECGDEFHAAFCLHNLGSYYLETGNFPEAERYLDEVLDIYQAFDSKTMLGQALLGLGEIERSRDEYEKAEAYYRENLAMNKEAGLGSHWFISCNLNLGFTSLHQGDDKAALAFFREAYQLNSKFENDKERRIIILVGYGAVAAFLGNGEEAALLFGAVEANVQTIIDEGGRRETLIEPVDQRELDHYQALARSQCGDAAYEALLEKGRGMSLDEAMAFALEKYPRVE